MRVQLIKKGTFERTSMPKRLWENLPDRNKQEYTVVEAEPEPKPKTEPKTEPEPKPDAVTEIKKPSKIKK